MTGLTLPGMIDEPGWRSGRMTSKKPQRGPEPSQRTLLANENRLTAIGPELAGALDQAVAVGVGLEMVPGLDERHAGLLSQHFRDLGPELRMRVDAGADRGAPGRQLQHGMQGPAGPVDRQLDLPGVAADFLPQANRRGVGQVRPADLDDVVPLLRLVG